MRANTDNIEECIIRVIRDASVYLGEKNIRNDSAWTDEIFTRLTRYAYGLDLHVWSKKNSADPTINGWVYDFVICECRPPVDISKVLVAMESEWNRDFNEVKYDFYKLLHGRSILRVMIFQSRDVMRDIEELVKIVNNSEASQIGDRFLLAVWNDNDGFFFWPYTKA
jgi:hypothetical protein